MNAGGGIYRYWKDLQDGLIAEGVKYENVDLWRFDRKARIERFTNCRLQSNRSGIVHSSYYRLPSRNLQNIKSVVTVYDCIHEIYRSGVVLKSHVYAKSKALRGADHIIAISESTKKDIQKIYDVPDHKISVCYLNVNSHYLDPNGGSDVIHHKWSEALNKKYFIFVGARKRYKNFWLAVEAVSRTKNAYLYICGGGNLQNDEQEFIKTKLGNRYRYFSFLSIPELKLFYQNALALLYPSEYEGFGLPPMECILSGGRAIFQDTSSLQEIAPENYFGIVDYQNYEAYVDRVVSQSTNQSKNWAVDKKYIQYWKQYSMVTNTIKIYNKILS